MNKYDKFIAEMLWCKKCQLYKTRENVVVGEGSLKSEILLIGEAPGENESKTGFPFCGRSGKLLRELLEGSGIKNNVYITNTVKCRPPTNRDPTKEEIKSCLPYLKKQLEIIKPKAILGVGRISSKIIKEDFKISKDHGKIFKLKNGMLFMGVYHPAFLLRNRSFIKDTENELKNLKQELKNG